MKAALYDTFQGAIEVRDVAAPTPPADGVVLSVGACGICRSDWHGWMGNDPDIRMPHVPGHELAGEIVEIGKAVRRWKVGQRVTLPFVCGCGHCRECEKGDEQICDNQFQPGFTGWGGFADLVAVRYADTNLVELPPGIDDVTAASLGCRFATSFRAVVDQGRVEPDQWVAVHGCGGVGLSAIMIAAAFGARVIAVDVVRANLEMARSVGAEVAIDTTTEDAVEAILDHSQGGAHISLDAIGHPQVLYDSVRSLRKRGRHIQVGIMESGQHRAAVPIERIIARELELLGSHGMQAHRYPAMLEMITAGKLDPAKLITRTVTLDEAPQILTQMNEFKSPGVTIIDLGKARDPGTDAHLAL